MNTTVCKYHPGLPARWHCSHCQINYCSNCLQSRQSNQPPQCIVCKRATVSLGSGQSITPFWERLHQIFMFPLNKVPIALLLIMSLLVLIFNNAAFGIVVYMASVFLILKYSYVVLEDTAKGYMQPKAFSMSMLTEELELPFKQLFVLFVYASVGYAIHEFIGSQTAYGFTIGIAFVLPASIMVLAVKHTFFSAFNVRLILHVIRRIGWPYILLYAFLLLFISAANILSSYLDTITVNMLNAPGKFLINMYFLLSIFYLMGYALYQYHERLGFTIDFEPNDASRVKLRSPDETRITGKVKDISILVQEGAYELAVQRLEEMIETSPADFDARAYYQKLVTVLGKTDKARQHCADFVSRLLDDKLVAQAIKVFLACYEKDNEITLNKPAHRVVLAELMLDNGHAKVAMVLLNNIHNDFPSYEGTPKAYLLAAKIMTEHFSQDEKARQVLEFVIDQYPRHALIGEVKKLLRALDAMV